MQPTFESPFYRVTAKAIIYDDHGRLLVLKTAKGQWELPGGGWEHDEAYHQCLAREIQEELGVKVKVISPVTFIYRGHNRDKGFETLRIVSKVQLESFDFDYGDDMQSAQFVTREQFMDMDWTTNEGSILEHMNQIWPNGNGLKGELPAAA